MHYANDGKQTRLNHIVYSGSNLIKAISMLARATRSVGRCLGEFMNTGAGCLI